MVSGCTSTRTTKGKTISKKPIPGTWSRIVDGCLQHLQTTHKTATRLVELATAVPWHGALIMATGLRNKESGQAMTEATPRPEGVQPAVSAKLWNADKGRYSRPLSSLFPQNLLAGGTGTDFNAGVLLASCCSFLTGPGSRAWQKLTTPENWADYAATYGITRKVDLMDAVTSLREWACNEDDPHTVSTLQAAIDAGMAEGARTRKAKATKGTTKAKAKTTGSKHQALANTMTPVQARADASKWARTDLAQLRALTVLWAGVIKDMDAANAKAKAKATKVA